MTSVAACLRRARTLATLLIVLAVLIAAVVLAPGCDRVVNLTPFFDAQPDRDSGLADGGFHLDALPEDGNALGDGSVFPDDGHSLPDDGSALPSDGGATPTDGRATPSDGGPPPIDGSATSADDGAFPTTP